MSSSDHASPVPTLDRFFDPRAFSTDTATGVVSDPAGARAVFASHEFSRAIHHVLLKERSGAWRDTLARIGRVCGRDLAISLDRESARLGEPALGALPLETCLGYLERTFASHGWGVLKLDLTDAPDHGLVVAHLSHSYFVEVLGDVSDFVDPFPAGLLQGFFEHISGELLGCSEIACVRRGAPHCTFVITASERLEAVTPFFGREPAEAIIARLKA